jgi:hypothetical protein
MTLPKRCYAKRFSNCIASHGQINAVINGV